MNLVHVTAIARGVFIELLRRKDLAVLGLFAALFLLFVAITRIVGLENPATGTFLLNLSLTLITALAHVITLTTSARQLPDEMERRTLYPLLARPVRRADVVVGKWLASALSGMIVFAALMLAALVLVPKMEPYETATLLQLLLLQLPALALTAALAITFSLVFPRLLGLFLAAAMVFGAGSLARLAGGMPLPRLLPDPGRLNLVLRYTDGIPALNTVDFASLLLYGILWTVLLLIASAALFQRRAL